MTISLQSTSNRMSAYGGLHFFSELLDTVNLKGMTRDHLPVSLRKRAGHESSYEKIRSMVLAFVAGADSFLSQERLIDDAGYSALCPKASSDATYQAYLRKFTAKDAYFLNSRLTDLSLKLRNALFAKEQDFILDIDSTVHQQYGKKMESVGFNYNGVWGLDSLQAFDQFGFQYWMELRAGGTFTSNGVPLVISNVLKKVHRSKRKIVRADSGMCNTDVFNACFTANAKYVIAMREQMLEPLLPYIANFKRSTKIKFRDGRSCEIAHHIYRTKESHAPSRVVVIRAPKKQRELFGDPYDYHAWVTTLGAHEMTDEEVILLYHGRGNAENFIRELKNGFDMFHFPCRKLLVNRVYGIIAAIAYNLSRYAGHVLSPKAPHFSKIVRSKLVNLACQVIKKARRTFLRFNEHAYKEVRRLLDLQYQQFVSS